jgi:drug/metabolite transporter (DMT)-like permease
MYVVSRLAFSEVPPATLGLARLVVGVPALVLVLRRWPALWEGRFALLGGTLATTLILQFWGTDLSGAAAGSLLTLPTPVFVAIAAPFLLAEPTRPSQWAGIAVALAGAMLVSGFAGGSSLLGDILLVGSAATYAAFTVLGARPVRQLGALPVTAAASIWALPAMLVAALVELRLGQVPRAGPGTLLAVLYLGLGATALAWWAWYRGIERMPAARASVLFLLQPVVGVGLSLPVFGLRPTPSFAAGSALIVAGTLLASRR